MAKEPRPKGYPKLNNYKPSQFMLPTSHYDEKKAERAEKNHIIRLDTKEAVPIYRLSCNMEPAAVKVAYEGMQG